MRMIRHLFVSSKRRFPPARLDAIQHAISASEHRHHGEIVFAVESSLPFTDVVRGRSARDRADEVFARLRVWNTERNTGVLILSSAALQWAYIATRRNDMDGAIVGLLAAGGSAITFLAGQLLAWQQLSTAGYFAASNPANAFFYMITAVHGLHLTGGLVALGRTTARVWQRSAATAGIRLSVELCTIYWHFLLLVWLVLLGLVTGWTNDFVDICRQLLS